MHKGKVHMILKKTQELEQTISESILPYLRGIHAKMDAFAKTSDGRSNYLDHEINVEVWMK